jgi:magnesium chelatase family protein
MKKTNSFIHDFLNLEPIEVEVALLPGLPSISITGLPDAAIRESLTRIKSALRSQGFELPKREQVIVHLRPSFSRKSSCGLDLAIAAAYLAATGQIELSLDEKFYFYGELTLDGRVIAPDDCVIVDQDQLDGKLITGECVLPFPHGELRVLSDLRQISWVTGESGSQAFVRPPIPDMEFPKPAAELMAIVGAGEHSVMLAGPAGTGKSTFSEMLHKVLLSPNDDMFKVWRKIARFTGEKYDWRPMRQPHHSATSMAIIGGGLPPLPGEISRAHGGLIVFDEFLEFSPDVREALREPMEKKQITISRKGVSALYPADALYVATTNFCPCGKKSLKSSPFCRFSRTRCNSYLERLTGPVLDRFEILAITDTWQHKTKIPISDIFDQVSRAREFQLARGQLISNHKLAESEVLSQVDPFVAKNLLPDTGDSRRRKLALLRVARTCADLDGEQTIQAKHIEKSRQLTIANHMAIENVGS